MVIRKPQMFVSTIVALGVLLPACTNRSTPRSDDLVLSPELRRSLVLRTASTEQDLIAACMRQRGFEYIPEAVSIPSMPAEDENSFGMAQAVRNLANFSRPLSPNTEIRSRLDASSVNAYNEALNLTEASKSTVSEEDRSCRAEAYRKSGMTDVALLNSKLEVLSKSVASDKRVQPLLQEYIKCMRDQGYVVKSDDPTSVLESAYRTLVEQIQVSRDAKDFDAELSRFETSERELATTDRSCNRKLKKQQVKIL